MKKALLLVLILLIALTFSACSGKSKEGQSPNSNAGRSTSGGDAVSKSSSASIKMTFGKEEIIVKLYDNPTSKDFLTLLPLTIKLEDHAGTEKVSYIPKKLTTQDAPSGSDPSVGDFAYYAPWGNIAIYYKDFGYSSGLIILGTIEAGIEKLASIRSDDIVTIERIQ